MIFSIPSPIGGSFDVEIYDNTATLVYAATVGNEDFDPAITDPGDYILYYTYNGITQGFCFSIPPCGCPVFDGFEITGEGELTYMKLIFSFPDGFCAFAIDGVATGAIPGASVYYAPGHVEFDSIMDFVDEGGGSYSKTFLFLGFTTFTFGITLADGTPCEQDIIVTDGTCNGVTDYTITAATSGDDRFIRITTTSCAADCNSYTVNYFQLSPATATAGSEVHTVFCAGLPDVFDIEVTPTYNPPPAATATFAVQVINCCGDVTEKLITFVAPACAAPRTTAAFLALGGG